MHYYSATQCFLRDAIDSSILILAIAPFLYYLILQHSCSSVSFSGLTRESRRNLSRLDSREVYPRENGDGNDTKGVRNNIKEKDTRVAQVKGE